MAGADSDSDSNFGILCMQDLSRKAYEHIYTHSSCFTLQTRAGKDDGLYLVTSSFLVFFFNAMVVCYFGWRECCCYYDFEFLYFLFLALLIPRKSDLIYSR